MLTFVVVALAVFFLDVLGSGGGGYLIGTGN